jgi:hypothetical protein
MSELNGCQSAPSITVNKIYIPGFQEYVIAHKTERYLKIDKEKLPWSLCVGTLGIPGVLIFDLSSFFRLHKIFYYTHSAGRSTSDYCHIDDKRSVLMFICAPG